MAAALREWVLAAWAAARLYRRLEEAPPLQAEIHRVAVLAAAAEPEAAQPPISRRCVGVVAEKGSGQQVLLPSKKHSSRALESRDKMSKDLASQQRQPFAFNEPQSTRFYKWLFFLLYSLRSLPSIPSDSQFNLLLRISIAMTAGAGAGVLLLLASFLAPAADAAGIGFEFHHRFSDRVREWAEARAVPGVWWPEKGTVEYYAALADHDRALRGRSLAAANGSLLTFADGNATLRISSLGFLHYASVELGTPNVTFFVALDTGSDLFWVPCDCQQCSSLNLRGIEFNTYSSSNSSTSQKVFCNNTICDQPNACTSATNSCPYQVNYLSDNTSSSGVLVEDTLYLITEGPSPQVVEAPIVFGCGNNQTGSFLRGAAPNGLFGLGLDRISVPSILASRGFTSDSFSMCFGSDGIGRINFGDKGSSDQQETPLFMNSRNPTYIINITETFVGSTSINIGFPAIVDSGTSFTSLSDPMYTLIAQSFNAQVQETRINITSNFTFEYCYELSTTQTSIVLPDINFTTNGGSVFAINHPIILVQSQTMVAYCLAIMNLNGINIFGQNYLTGLRVVFDRERRILGWKNSDCYTDNTSTIAASPAPIQVHAPAPASSSSGGFTEQPTNSGGNSSQFPTGSSSSDSLHLKAMSSFSMAILMLSLAFIW